MEKEKMKIYKKVLVGRNQFMLMWIEVEVEKNL